jgi:hypothetical protein
LHDNGRGDPVDNRKKDEKKRRNHRENSTVPSEMQRVFSILLVLLLESQTSPAK